MVVLTMRFLGAVRFSVCMTVLSYRAVHISCVGREDVTLLVSVVVEARGEKCRNFHAKPRSGPRDEASLRFSAV